MEWREGGGRVVGFDNVVGMAHRIQHKGLKNSLICYTIVWAASTEDQTNGKVC